MDIIIYIGNNYPYMYILIHPIHLKRRFINLIILKPFKAIGFLLDHRLVWWSVESTSLLSGLALSENSVTHQRSRGNHPKMGSLLWEFFKCAIDLPSGKLT